MGRVVNFLTKILDTVEPETTIELDEIIFSKKHGHEICVMHILGKNIFPKMTTDEILSNPKARAGLSKEDLIFITKLDTEIKLKRNKFHVREVDRNGTVVIENDFGERKRYSERVISVNPELLDKLDGRNAHSIGYRVGFKDGMMVNNRKQALIDKFLSFLRFKKA